MNLDQILGKTKDVSEVPKKRFDESTKAGPEINRLTDLIHENINVSYQTFFIYHSFAGSRKENSKINCQQPIRILSSFS